MKSTLSLKIELARYLTLSEARTTNLKTLVCDPYARITLIAAAVVCLSLGCFVGKAPSNRIKPSDESVTLGPGTHTRQLEFNGLTRTYRIHIPVSYDKARSVPLVLAFHGGLGSGEAMAKLSNLDDVSDRKGFIVAYPDGVGRSWNAGHGTGMAERRQVDDVGFISELIDDLAHDFHIDRRQVYATGMSNGAIFVHRLGCELSDKIAAIGPVAGTIPPQIAGDCHPARPISVIEFHGTADSDSPWDGGRTLGGGQVESVSVTIQGWAARDHCSPTPQVTTVAKDVVCETYAPCEKGAEVRLYRIEKGGHTWPGGYQYLPRSIIGETNRALNASEVIWDFFQKHPLN